MVGMSAERKQSAVRAVTVLVADDMPDIRLLLRAALELDEQFEVVAEAADGAQCLELAEQHQPNAVVIDLGMPGGNGLDTVARLRSRLPATRIVVLSGQQKERIAEEAKARGADAYLQKGSAVDRLVVILRELFAA